MPDRTDTQYPAADASMHGYGAQWLVGDGESPETFEAVAFVRSITPGPMETADINATHLRSPDAHHEHRPGLRDSGAFTVAGIWVPTEQSHSNAGGGSGAFAEGGLVALWRTRAIRNQKIVLTDASPATEWPFRGYIRRFQPGEIGATDIVNFTAEVQPTQASDADLP